MAQKLKFGNGTWATKKGSTLAYNDENNNYKPLPFTTTRNSIATRVNKEGLIEVVGNDVPRIDYTDSAEGVLLLENSATNLITYSEDFSQWTLASQGNGSTPILTSNYGTYLGLNYSRIQFSRASVSTSNISTIRGNDFTQSTNTFSIYIKSNTSNVNIDFRLGSSIVSYEITNNWKRIEFNGSDFYRSYFGLIGNDSDLSADLSIVAAQAESGNVATSYIPTNGTTVTRLADTASGSGNSEVFNDSQGVLFLNLNTSDTSAVPIISLSNGSASNEIEFAYFGTNQFNFILRVSGGTPNVVGTVNASDFSKFSVSYTATDFKVYLNGFLIGSNTLPSPLSGLNTLDFNFPSGANHFYGKTKEIAYYDEILTDLELETLTSYRSLNELVTELNLNTL
jgi:hypothetical protein